MISSQYLLVVAVCFVTLGWATSAVPIMANSTGISWHPANHTQSTCDPSTFDEPANTDPADWRECASLYSSWTSENGTFRLGDLNATGFTPILQTRDCTLGVKPADPCLGPFTIGDRDIKTLLETSLKEYSEGTDLRVAGNVKCATAIGSKGDVNWRISKSKGDRRLSWPYWDYTTTQQGSK
ncbi:hypothetical protein MAC_08560 [Metarhizium acridum CQMa 102]|uniref:Ecp2 effector protein-like domain-containing protein n=1 Tax=Metarhizium acridum (strain CQMa 102) TaxID=655827 RepID=E9EFB2_METAQ|nr:uncharacterized protein MAC_08560 [Metarhizium acridum CQMa 102]EFY85428.1 hypothetical protein MAC_08560 [Metarhizium acridum CQMa 102]